MCSFKSLRIGFLCGVAGVLVDADRITLLFFKESVTNQWFPAPQLQSWVEPFCLRPLHPQIFLVSSIVLFCMVTYIAGLYIKLVLRKRG